MSKSSRPFSSGSRQPPDPIDHYLTQIGYYRKHVARDASSLFRVFAELMFDAQMYHPFVRQLCVHFMAQNKNSIQKSIKYDVKDYLTNLTRCRTHGTLLELKALAYLFKRNVILFEPMTAGQYFVQEPEFRTTLQVFCSNDNHYDIIYTQSYIVDAAFCQSLCYEIIYSHVYKLPDVVYAVEKMLHDQTDSTEIRPVYKHAEDDEYPQAIYLAEGREFLLDGPYNTKCILDNYLLCCFHNRHFEKLAFTLEREMYECATSRHDNVEERYSIAMRTLQSMLPEKFVSCVRQLLMNGITPFPYKVAKALDPDIYRNIEYDTWSEWRKEQRMENHFRANNCLQIGSKCQIKPEYNERSQSCYVQAMESNKGPCVVFIEETGERKTVPYTSLTLLPSNQWRENYMRRPLNKPFFTEHYDNPYDSHMQWSSRRYFSEGYEFKDLEHRFRPYNGVCLSMKQWEDSNSLSKEQLCIGKSLNHYKDLFDYDFDVKDVYYDKKPLKKDSKIPGKWSYLTSVRNFTPVHYEILAAPFVVNGNNANNKNNRGAGNNGHNNSNNNNKKNQPKPTSNSVVATNGSDVKLVSSTIDIKTAKESKENDSKKLVPITANVPNDEMLMHGSEYYYYSGNDNPWNYDIVPPPAPATTPSGNDTVGRQGFPMPWSRNDRYRSQGMLQMAQPVYDPPGAWNQSNDSGYWGGGNSANTSANSSQNTYQAPINRRDLLRQQYPVKLDSRPSLDSRGLDLPQDTGTIRFFYNLGIGYFGQLRSKHSMTTLAQLPRGGFTNILDIEFFDNPKLDEREMNNMCSDFQSKMRMEKPNNQKNEQQNRRMIYNRHYYNKNTNNTGTNHHRQYTRNQGGGFHKYGNKSVKDSTPNTCATGNSLKDNFSTTDDSSHSNEHQPHYQILQNDRNTPVEVGHVSAATTPIASTGCNSAVAPLYTENSDFTTPVLQSVPTYGNEIHSMQPYVQVAGPAYPQYVPYYSIEGDQSMFMAPVQYGMFPPTAGYQAYPAYGQTPHVAISTDMPNDGQYYSQPTVSTNIAAAGQPMTSYVYASQPQIAVAPQGYWYPPPPPPQMFPMTPSAHNSTVMSPTTIQQHTSSQATAAQPPFTNSPPRTLPTSPLTQNSQP